MKSYKQDSYTAPIKTCLNSKTNEAQITKVTNVGSKRDKSPKSK